MHELKTVSGIIVPLIFWGILLDIIPGANTLVVVLGIPFTIVMAFIFFSFFGLTTVTAWDWLFRHGYVTKPAFPRFWYSDNWTGHLKYAAIGLVSFIACMAISILVQL